jgi:predicted nucleic acid-binding protein
MKPPLEALQVTDEDFDIYVRMAGRYRKHGYAVLKLYDTADRRDAELMLTAQAWRFRGLGAITRYPTSSGDLVDCRGGMGWDFV